MANCWISPVQEIGKCMLTQCLWPLIKPHFDFWWCFDSNIQELKDGIRDLDRKTLHTSQKLEEARLRLEVVRPGVEKWLKESTEKLAQAQTILPDYNIPKACYLISRYSLGKKAKETAEDIAKHLNNGNFDQIADPGRPAAMASPSQTSTNEFESRNLIEEEIIDSLKQSVGVIGICGMGGIGKTTMAERIMERVKKENLFDEVVMVTVSKQKEMFEIQEEIAEWLGLTFSAKHMSTRAVQLRTRLTDPKTKIIIFDDVWKSLKLKDLGVPQSCKILLTTRFKDVCEKMDAQKIIEMETLTEEEAWILFKEKAGVCLEDSTLHSVAKDIVSECKCLPIALVIVGKSLQNKPKSVWEDSLKQLREPDRAYFGEVEEDVYKPLKMSYDYLDDDRQRYLFLLCCLFPEDYDIPIEQLAWYIMGLQLFDDINNIKAARNRTDNLVGKLKSRFLLIDGEDKLHVRMHDVVRDVAIYIGSKEKNGFLKNLHRTSIENSFDANCNWISVDISNELMEVSVVSRFPNLRLLMLQKSKSRFPNLRLLMLHKSESSSKEFSDICFEGMKELNVLSFERAAIGSLPPTLGSLEKLQTLCLFRCEVRNISVVGKLTSLKILICYVCTNIKELPGEIGSLSGLRLLELNECRKLQRIPFGVISSLTRLEELKMRGSFNRWEAEENGKEKRNASLTELGSLPNLSCLEIEIDDCTLSAQEICLSQNLVKYYVRIGSRERYDYFETRDDEKVMILNLPSGIGAVGKWIEMQVRNTEWLYLRGDGCGSNNFNIAEIENLRILTVRNCSTLKKLVETKDCKFHNLKSIKISGCDNLRSLFSVSAARRCLLQLEELYIRKCESMEQVFWNEGTDDNTDGCIEFPKLKQLRLMDLPNLTAFCQGLENIIIKFPNLTNMWIEGLPKLNSLSPLNSETLVGHDHNTCFHFLCNPKVEMGPLKGLTIQDMGNNIRNIWCHQIPNNVFNSLETLSIYDMNGIRSLMSTSIAKNLESLKKLRIISCEEMVEVIERDDVDDKQVAESLSLGGDGSDNINQAEMENLRNLEFTNCSTVNKLVDTSDLNQNVSFCNLKSIAITRCPKLRSLFSVSVARRCLLQLEVLEIRYCESMEQVFWSEGTDDNTDDGCIEFPKMKELTLENLRNLTAFCQGLEKKDVSFCNLKSIRINKCDKLRSLFSVSAARRCLLQLEDLYIGECESMEQVFWSEGTDDNTDGCIEFPKMKELTLWNLRNLTAFCQGLENIIIKFPNLTQMQIGGGLPKLNSVCPLNSKTHDQNTCFHFLCNPKVKMGPLKNLILIGSKDTNISHIWCHQIPNNVFNNLEELHIYSMNGISSLMSTSIAKNLVSLKCLEISNCEEMVEVIERDDDDKQVVAINYLFANLRVLSLQNLDKLRRFWQWNHALELPLLESIRISNCPMMETFTLGSINTPNIMEVNYEKIDHPECLNDVIRHIWTQSQNKHKGNNEYVDKNENKDEDGYEDENKDDQDHFRIKSEEDEDNMIMDINDQHKIGEVSLKIKKDVGVEGEQPI